MRVARENMLTQDTAVKDDTCINNIQNISLADEPTCPFTERTTTQASLKRKKKHFDNKRTVDETSSDIQCKKQFIFFLFLSYLVHFYVPQVIKISFVNIFKFPVRFAII